jgi:hypothetical protein
MNVRPIVWTRFAWRHRLVNRLRAFHHIRRLRHVWFRGIFLHAVKPCNKPALEGFD